MMEPRGKLMKARAFQSCVRWPCSPDTYPAVAHEPSMHLYFESIVQHFSQSPLIVSQLLFVNRSWTSSIQFRFFCFVCRISVQKNFPSPCCPTCRTPAPPEVNINIPLCSFSSQVPTQWERSPGLWRLALERAWSWGATCPLPWTASNRPMWWSGSSSECLFPSSSTSASTLLMWIQSIPVRWVWLNELWENTDTLWNAAFIWHILGWITSKIFLFGKYSKSTGPTGVDNRPWQYMMINRSYIGQKGGLKHIIHVLCNLLYSIINYTQMWKIVSFILNHV